MSETELPAGNAEELAWCVAVFEDVAKRLDDTWPNYSLMLRCERALRWLVGEVERLEKIAYPIAAPAALSQPAQGDGT